DQESPARRSLLPLETPRLKREPAPKLKRARPTGSKGLPGPITRLTEIEGLWRNNRLCRGIYRSHVKVLAIAPEVRDVEDVEYFKECLDRVGLLELECLRQSDILGLKILAEVEALRKNHWRNGSAAGILLAGKSLIERVDQIEQVLLGSP